jgi:hypothetical protein
MSTLFLEDDFICELDDAELVRDLDAEGYNLVSLSNDGDLRVFNRETEMVEVWQARVPGCGTNNWVIGGYEDGFEFCRSYAPSEFVA